MTKEQAAPRTGVRATATAGAASEGVDRLHRPTPRIRLADQLYEQILQQIVTGELPEGQRLPSENQLCGVFGVSRPVVREALFRLQADGLVMAMQGSGTYVQRRPNPEVLALAPPGGVAEILRCFELRIALEGEAAFYAAQRRTPEDVRAMRAANENLERVIAARELGADADIAFHQAVAVATHNDLFVDTLASLRSLLTAGLTMTRSLSLKKEAARMQRVQNEHVAIEKAIAEGDADRARTAMRHHIDNARTRLVSDRAEP